MGPSRRCPWQETRSLSAGSSTASPWGGECRAATEAARRVLPDAEVENNATIWCDKWAAARFKQRDKWEQKQAWSIIESKFGVDWQSSSRVWPLQPLEYAFASHPRPVGDCKFECVRGPTARGLAQRSAQACLALLPGDFALRNLWASARRTAMWLSIGRATHATPGRRWRSERITSSNEI